jgi:hypothetical protein
MKRRIVKKHNNTESGKKAPDYAKGIKVYEYGYWPSATDKDKYYMTYCTKKPRVDAAAVWYNKVKRLIPKPHSDSEFEQILHDWGLGE